MRRTVVWVALVLMGLPCLAAAGTGDFVLSPRIGLNLADFIGNDVTSKTSFREGVCFGWCVEYPVNPRLVARCELLYTQKGAEIKFGEGALLDKLVFRVDYMELPILLRFNLTTGGTTTPFVLAGPAFAVRTCSQGALSTVQGDEQPFFLNGYEDFDMGITGGAGVTFPIFNRLGFAEVRYNYGITKFDKSNCAGLDDEDVCNKDDKRNGVISIVFGLQTK
jgi:hypothetical protein